jgi:hypothetical protein
MAGFIALVFLLGFPLAVPCFIFGYLVIAGRERWLLSLALCVDRLGSVLSVVPEAVALSVRCWLADRRRHMRRWFYAALAAFAAAPVLAQGSFYEGKTVTVVIGASGRQPGDRVAHRRAPSRPQLPGNPNVIVQNMTGPRTWSRPTTSTTWPSPTG